MTTEQTNNRETNQPVLRTEGFHHVALRVTDLVRARAFYTTVLGFPVVHEAEGLVVVSVDGTLLGLRGGAPETETIDRFSPFRVGLDHVALAVRTTGVLRDVQRHLDVAGVPNDGIEEDRYSGTVRVRFYDPDGIVWELVACGECSSQSPEPTAAAL
jgi:catechol 2,3-dioxygenase-like lactoylglutathione lyase family enzyme